MSANGSILITRHVKFIGSHVSQARAAYEWLTYTSLVRGHDSTAWTSVKQSPSLAPCEADKVFA